MTNLGLHYFEQKKIYSTLATEQQFQLAEAKSNAILTSTSENLKTAFIFRLDEHKLFCSCTFSIHRLEY